MLRADVGGEKHRNTIHTKHALANVGNENHVTLDEQENQLT